MTRFIVLLLACTIIAGCTEVPNSGSPCKAASAEVRVFAASSLTDAVNDWKAEFEKSGEFKVKASFGASSDLARQILQGAPCDLFIAASEEWMTKLSDQGALDGKPQVIARNVLVCVAPKDGSVVATDVHGLRAPGLMRLAIADENVPAGKYARQALKHAGVLDAIRGHFVGQKDVRAVLSSVACGECDAGFVYATDAQSSPDVRELFRFPLTSHAPIVYPAALCKESSNAPAARKLLDYISGSQGQAALKQRGFIAGDAP